MRVLFYSFIFLFALTASAVNAQGKDYLLGVGDSIKVLVYDEPDLTVETIVGDDGDINYPFLGSVLIEGKTTRQVEKDITKGLKGDYLINPSVQVSIVEYRSFYIHGEVKKPGAYPYKPGLNIDQAIALAGGLTERASEDKIFIKHDKGGEVELEKVSVTYLLSPGETVNIKQSFF